MAAKTGITPYSAINVLEPPNLVYVTYTIINQCQLGQNQDGRQNRKYRYLLLGNNALVN